MRASRDRREIVIPNALHFFQALVYEGGLDALQSHGAGSLTIHKDEQYEWALIHPVKDRIIYIVLVRRDANGEDSAKVYVLALNQIEKEVHVLTHDGAVSVIPFYDVDLRQWLGRRKGNGSRIP